MKAYVFYKKELKKINRYLNNSSRVTDIAPTQIQALNIPYVIFHNLTSQSTRNIIWDLYTWLKTKKRKLDYDLSSQPLVKMFAIDYVSYILENRHRLEIPLVLFPKKDHHVILRFLKSYIWASYLDKIPMALISKNLRIYLDYQSKINIKIRAGFFEINEFRNIKPFGELHDYGLKLFHNRHEVCFDLGACFGDTA